MLMKNKWEKIPMSSCFGWFYSIYCQNASALDFNSSELCFMKCTLDFRFTYLLWLIFILSFLWENVLSQNSGLLWYIVQRNDNYHGKALWETTLEIFWAKHRQLPISPLHQTASVHDINAHGLLNLKTANPKRLPWESFIIALGTSWALGWLMCLI
jgi:hypothetical protein